MSRRDRREGQRPEGASALADAPPPAAAPLPAHGVLPPGASDTDAVCDPLPPPASPEAAPRFYARVRIHAGATYEPGEEIPATIAADGFTEGVEYRREG